MIRSEWVQCPIPAEEGFLVELDLNGKLIPSTKKSSEIGSGPIGGGGYVIGHTHLSVTQGDDGEPISGTHPKNIFHAFTVPPTFYVLNVNVLKFFPGTQDVSRTVCGFSNSDADDFVASNRLQFDGVMKPRTSYQGGLTYSGLGQESTYLFTFTLPTQNVAVRSISIS